ncbi:hypothetical protein ACFPVX_08415 [Cohnella faecalis]|uniref:Glycosyltransferase RgtA/B/C/D-like domain-containing protein n=1 Tax=Cohnella faecalis TaxID=2315694 RepID=A0A398CKL6_9BACL|nr:hypothetical protein [Cohnella faecalis]RIE01418.1 hypothetical protein D3H35_23915 [Cohnella faecalis]
MFKRLLKIDDWRKPIAWFFGIAGAALLIWLLMIPPVIGVADNGDFNRVMGASGIAPLNGKETYEDHYFAFSHARFGYGDFHSGGYVSTHVILVAAIGLIARIFNGLVFDIRWLGAAYIGLFLAAVILLVRYVPVPKGARRWGGFAVAVVLGTALLFVFADVGYSAYYQSFFGEPFAMLAMLLATAAAFALASRDRPSGGLLTLFIVASLALASSKIQNAPLGFAFALLGWRMFGISGNRRWHRQVLIGIAVLVAGATIMLVAAPDKLRHINLYQSIFYGVLKDSPHVAEDMRELRIPEKYRVNAGTNFFQHDTAIPQNDPTLRKEVLETLSHKDIAMYYLRHPSRFIQKLERASDNAVFVRPYYLGNYDKTAGKPRGQISYAYSGWSEWKAKHIPRYFGWFAGFIGLYMAAIAVWRFRTVSLRQKFMAETLAAVAIIGVFAACIPLIGDGEADLSKHLFMFNVCFDMMVVSAVTALAFFLVKLTAPRRVQA